MPKIKIKIQDLFERLNIENSCKNTFDIKIKNNNNTFVPIKEFVKLIDDVYETTFNNNIKLLSSNRHMILTKSGFKKIKDIDKNDDILLSNGKIIHKIKTKLKNKNHALYDFCLEPPHTFIDTNGLIHHNSLIIAYIIKTLIENNVIKHALIVVPTVSLCMQMKNDMEEYGINVPIDVIFSGSNLHKKIKITFNDNSIKYLNIDDIVETKRGKILAKNLKKDDEII